MPDLTVDAAIRDFERAGWEMRCSEVQKKLTSLGFVVRNGSRGNHKVFGHPRLADFHGSDYDCGHGANPKVKLPYIKKNILPVLRKYRDDLKKILEG